MPTSLIQIAEPHSRKVYNLKWVRMGKPGKRLEDGRGIAVLFREKGEAGLETRPRFHSVIRSFCPEDVPLRLLLQSADELYELADLFLG
jgi:hypothetical protein